MSFQSFWNGSPSGNQRDDVKVEESNEATEGPSISDTAPLVKQTADKQFVSTIFQTIYWRILPFTALFVMLSYIDRGNVGFVAADLCQAFGLSNVEYGVSVSLFGVGYITSQIPSNYILRKVGAATWFAVLLIFWGVVAACFSLVKNKVQFYVLRVMLGIAEGGVFPAAWYYLSLFFPQNYLTFPNSTIEASIAISSVLASPMAALCLAIGTRFNVTGWRVLFVFEGVLPILFGIFVFFTLPSTPEKASYLSSEQKQWLLSHQPQDEPEHNLLQEMGIVFRKLDFYALGTNVFMKGALLTLAMNWTTLIISQIIYGDTHEGHCGNAPTDIKYVLLTAVPFAIAAVFSLWLGHKTTNSKRRPLIVGSMMICAALFLFGFAFFQEDLPVLALLFLSFADASFMGPNSISVSLVNSYFHKEARATGIAALNTIVGLGMIVGPLLIGYLVEYKGYSITVTVLAAMTFCTGIFLLGFKDPLKDSKSESTDAV